jgi:hypothetical protein
MHGTHARYALLLHLLGGSPDTVIPTATVERARVLVREYLLPNATDFFGLTLGGGIERVRDIAGWILTNGMERFVASDIKAAVWTCRSLSGRELNEVLDPLITGGWLAPETDFPSNRAWFVNPALRRHFAEREKAERERRRQTREVFQTIGRRTPREEAPW